jgi:plasmid stabilization system protein ParE
MSRGAVRISRNFEHNLETIRRYVEEHAGAHAFEALLDTLFDTVIPNLESSPAIGYDFLARKPLSVEGRAKVKALRAKLGEGVTIREYIAGDYLRLSTSNRQRIADAWRSCAA